MKQEINLEEILEDSLKDFNNNGFHGINSLVGYQSDLIKEAMKQACSQCLDLAAENAEAYYPQEPINMDSILQIKDWIK